MIQAVITYRNNGTHRACGQTVGADGRGTFAILVEADTPEAGEEKAYTHVKLLKDSMEYPKHITDIVVVDGYEGYGGKAITVI